MKYQHVKERVRSLLEPRGIIYFTRIAYSFGILFIILFIIYEKIIAHFFEGIVEKRITGYTAAFSKLSTPSGIFDSFHILILPALLLLVFFIILFFILRCHDKRRYLITALVKSFIITIVFTFISLKLAFFAGSLQREIVFFHDIHFAQVFGFMLIYSVPISLSVLINHDNTAHNVRDFIVFILLIIIANIPTIIRDGFSTGSLFFTLQGMGTFYFLGTMISVLSCLDFLVADMDSGPAGFLIYLGLPAYIVLVISAFIFLILYFLIGLLFQTNLGGFEIFVPFEQLYYYMKELIYYKDPWGFIFSILGITAVIQISLTLFKKNADDEGMDWSFSQISRSILGLGFISYFLSIRIPLPWYIPTLVIFSLLLGLYFVLKKVL